MANRMSSIAGIALAGVVMVSAAASAQTDRQIAFVNMERVFSEYHKTKDADERLKEEADTLNTERGDMIAALEALEQEFRAAKEEAQDPALSEDGRQRKREEAEDKLLELREQQTKIRRFEETRRKELEEKGRRLRADIVEEIDVVLKAYARGRELLAVFDSSGNSFNQVPIVLYSDSRADITDQIVALLNKGQPALEPAAAEAP